MMEQTTSHTDDYIHTENINKMGHRHHGTGITVHTGDYMNTQNINMMEHRHHGTDTTYIQITT